MNTIDVLFLLLIISQLLIAEEIFHNVQEDKIKTLDKDISLFSYQTLLYILSSVFVIYKELEFLYLPPLTLLLILAFRSILKK